MTVLKERRAPVDLILTDVVMPEMSGGELAVAVERQFPDSKILFMSGYPTTMIEEHGTLEAGVSFLEKPFSAEALKRSIARGREKARAVLG